MNNQLKVRLGAAALAFITLAVLAQAQQPEERFQRTFTVNAGSTLKVDNYKGTVHVTGTNTNQVVVNVLKRFEGGSEADRKSWMENTKVNFRNDSGAVEVTVEYPSQTFSCWFCWQERYVAQVELEIQVPSRTNLDVNGYKPDIRISSVQGDIHIKSYKAPMTLDTTIGSIHIDTYKDEIQLKNVAVRGGIDIKSYKAGAEIDAKSLEGTAYLETSRGSIVLRVPRDIGLNVDFAGGRRSDFHTDFTLATQAGGSRGRDVRGTINGGGAHLVLRTDRGSVSIGKRAGEL